jgi:hypothetical protein
MQNPLLTFVEAHNSHKKAAIFQPRVRFTKQDVNLRCTLVVTCCISSHKIIWVVNSSAELKLSALHYNRTDY